MRVYVATTPAGLRDLHARALLGPAPLAGHAVTPALVEAYAEGDTEELEYVALTAAARESLQLLAVGDDPSPRRVVVAVDVADAAVTAVPSGRSAVEVAIEVPLRDVGAIHVDDAAVAPVVRAALAALRADPAAVGAAVEDAQAEDLMWFATQELPDLLA